MPAGKIGLVYPRLALDSVPSLCQTVELLAAAGYSVDVFTFLSADTPDPVFSRPDIRLIPIGQGTVAGGSLPGRATSPLQRARRYLGWPLRRALSVGRQTGSQVESFRKRIRAEAYVRRASRLSPYRCFIGVDPDGLDLAARYAAVAGCDFVYYSLELLLSSEIRKRGDRQQKARERALSQQALFTICQDEQRGGLLALDNGLPADRMVHVPNAPLGPARRSPSHYWHRRFGLDASRKVVLHTGSLGDWTGIEDIAASARKWPEEWVLVIHTRYDAASSAYVEHLREACDPSRVFFSLKPVPRQDYAQLVDGGDVGIAFYVPSNDSPFTQQNIATVGLSSGKLAYYLGAGLPVIVNRATSVSELIQAANAGIAVSEAGGIASALELLAPDLSRFSARACAFFEEHLDFSRAFQEVLHRLKDAPAPVDTRLLTRV